VVVALQSVPRGMRVPPDAIEIREWRKDDRDYPDDPALRLSDVVGKMARVDIPRQRPIDMSMVVDGFGGDGSEMALAIPKGKVAIAVPVRILSAVAGAIHPNDRVDVLVSFSFVEVDVDQQLLEPVTLVDCDLQCQKQGAQIPRLVSQYTVQNVPVLSLGLWSEEPEPVVQAAPAGEGEPAEAEELPPPPASGVEDALIQRTSVTLVVSPQDALVLKWATEVDATIDLAMRSAVDADIYAQPESVTLQYMLDRFQISVPPKLPQALTIKPFGPPVSADLEDRLLDESVKRLPVGGE
jgi:Flp pilus assembly protein CpaB